MEHCFEVIGTAATCGSPGKAPGSLPSTLRNHLSIQYASENKGVRPCFDVAQKGVGWRLSGEMN
jgi:hypothetical protein